MAARPLSLSRLPLLMLLGGLALAATPAEAQQSQIPSPYQRRCPRLAPANNPTSVQPLRIQPGQVPRKNARGCLSPADAVYGPDGCPRQLCGADAGVIQLPVPEP
ncbi:MAG: hypothetical protein FJ054_13970 [Cyanobacteria bacterium M_surface_10_m2_119]|nr:hypothetical protein [Cyanobacteria bacterium M_surface_10_m2_119]